MNLNDELVTALWHDAPSFATSTKLDRHHCDGSIKVQGRQIVDMPLPLSSKDLDILVGMSKGSRFGLLGKSVVNKEVRHSLSIEDACLSGIPLEEYAASLVAKMMGVQDTNSISLEVKQNGLLIYKKGGHFKMHRDQERVPGAFATMVLQVPAYCGYQGGQLVVQHEAEAKTFDFSEDSKLGFFATVFFSDCNHEVLEVTNGMVYSLVRTDARTPVYKNLKTTLASFATRLARLENTISPFFEKDPTKDPVALAIPLSHKYTESGLCFAGLKGRDRMVFELLHNVNGRALDVHLCILTRRSIHSFTAGHWISVHNDDLDSSLPKLLFVFQDIVMLNKYQHEDVIINSDVYMAAKGHTLASWYRVPALAI